MPLLCLFLLTLTRVQTLLAQIASNKLSEKLKTTVSIGKLEIDLFDHLELDKVFVADLSTDTLFSVERLRLDFKKIDFKHHSLFVKKLEIDGANYELKMDSLTMNLDFLLNAFASSDTTPEKPSTSKPWTFKIDQLLLKDTKFSLKMTGSPPPKWGMDYFDMAIDSIQLKASDVVITDHFNFKLEQFGLRDKSGLRIKQFSALSEVSDKHIVLQGMRLDLPRSSLKTECLTLSYKAWPAFVNYVEEVDMEAMIKHGSYINIEDVAFFTETLKGFDLLVGLEGYAKGTVSNIKCEDIKLSFGDNTNLLVDFSMKGLTDVDHTVFHGKIKDMNTCRKDLELITLYPFDQMKKLSLPSFINPNEPLSLQCEFKGLLTDFNFTSELKSNIGNVVATLEYAPDEMNPKGSNFIGYVSTENFILSKLAGTGLLNRISFEAYLDGQTSVDSTKAQLKGVVKNFDFNHYAYNNIKLEGVYKDKTADFSAELQDMNINMKLGGKVLTAPKNPVYQLYVDCRDAKLGHLNLDTTDYSSFASFRLNTIFTGTELDSMRGVVDIDHLRYGRKTGEMKIDKLQLSLSDSANFSKNIRLTSDVANAHVYGNFSFLSITDALISTLTFHLPSLDSLLGKASSVKPQDMHFKVDLIKPSLVLNVFNPDLGISPNTSIVGNFNSADSVFNIKTDTLSIKTSGARLNKLQINAERNKAGIDLKTYLKSVNLGENKIDSVSLKFNAHNDTIASSLMWDNGKLKENYSGEISYEVALRKLDHKKWPAIKATLFPSIFTIADTTWSLKQSDIYIDTTSIMMKNFKIFSSLNEYLQVEGKVSENVNDTLNLKLNNIHLSQFNHFLPNTGFKLDGKLYGKTSVSSLYDKPMIVSNDSISDFKVNDRMLGDFFFNSKFDPSGDKLDVHTFLMDDLQKDSRDTSKTLSVNGSFNPKTGELDFVSKIEYLDLSFLDPLLKDYLSNTVGFVSCDTLSLTGTIDKPIYTGNFKLSKFATQFDYLKTYFNTDGGVVSLSNHKIGFKRLKLNGDNREAVLEGFISHNNFSDMKFNLDLAAENFCFLNTQEKDNNLYYGKANASGLVNITGTLDKIRIDVNARTEKDTKLCIPIFSGSDVAENKFLTFKKPQAEMDSLAAISAQNVEYNVDLSKLEMNLNLDVTPDAEVQIIMNEKTGDMIKAKGKGNINLSIDTKGKFEMQGNYIISKGDYQFSLQNVINKKFTIENGSSINWTGDPTSAKIDISALYHLKKVSLYDLVLEDEYKEERVPVDCKLKMTNELLNPSIKFGIVLPQKEERIASQVSSLAVDDLNKQFLSLLVINRFQPLPGLRGQVESKSTSFGLTSNASELLSNQLSNWLSQINNDVDIGVNYRANDSINKSQVELALSTQIFNERLKLNGNVNMKMQDQSSNNLVGEFDVEYKISKNLSAKYYNRLNDNNHYEVTPYRMGLGVFYQKDFNRVAELFKRENKEEIIKRKRTKKDDKSLKKASKE